MQLFGSIITPTILEHFLLDAVLRNLASIGGLGRYGDGGEEQTHGESRLIIAWH